MNYQEAMINVQTVLGNYFGDRFQIEQPLGKFTSARVGGNAEMLVTVKSAEELKFAAETAYKYGVPYFVLGGGSNILMSDTGCNGLVIHNRAKRVSFRNTGISVVCTAESGTNISSLTRQCINKGLGGLEWAIGVPGTVGGAVFGNSGAHGSDMAANLIAARVWQPGKGERIITNRDMAYGYRTSIFKEEVASVRPRTLILEAEIELTPEPVELLASRADAFNAHRKQTQPNGATMGSMFKNPKHFYAGYLIEAAGLKGTRIGGVYVSEKHANFFINDMQATAEDIRALLAEAYNTVREQFDIALEPEIELVGEWGFDDAESKSYSEDTGVEG